MQTEASGDSGFAGFNGKAGESLVSEPEDETQEADPLQGEPGQRGQVRVPGRRAGGRVRAGGGRGHGREAPGDGEVFPPEYLDFTTVSERGQWGQPKPDSHAFEQQ